jgi:hypothetical protein
MSPPAAGLPRRRSPTDEVVSMLLKLPAASGVLAQTVDVTPDASGMPGGALIQQLLNWSQMLALWGSLGAILIGAAMYGLAQHGNSYAGASRGKTLAMGGVVGAILAGLAPAAVNLLFNAASG